jgi:inorganic pyrophosphatase
MPMETLRSDCEVCQSEFVVMGVRKAIKRMGAFNAEKKCINVVIETPKGSRVKYSYDEETGLLRLKKALPEGMVFPFNFGFIPGTKAEDGDPLDVLIVNEEALVPGCLVEARPIAVIEAKQGKKGGKQVRNDRLVAKAIGKQTPTFMESLDLDKKTLGQIEYFFVSYNKLSDNEFTVLGRGGEKKAVAMVHQAEQRKQKG